MYCRENFKKSLITKIEIGLFFPYSFAMSKQYFEESTKAFKATSK